MKIGDRKLFLSGLDGIVKLCTVISIGKSGIRIRIKFDDGGTDATTKRFLFDIPAGLVIINKDSKSQKIETIIQSIVERYGVDSVGMIKTALSKCGYTVCKGEHNEQN